MGFNSFKSEGAARGRELLRETSGISGLKKKKGHNFSVLPPMKLIYSSKCSSFQELFNGTGLSMLGFC